MDHRVKVWQKRLLAALREPAYARQKFLKSLSQ
jgi:hypothetical protein